MANWSFNCICCSRHVYWRDTVPSSSDPDSLHTYGSRFFPEGAGVCGHCYASAPDSILRLAEWEGGDDMDEVINTLLGVEEDNFEELDLDGVPDEVVSQIASHKMKVGGMVRDIEDKTYYFEPGKVLSWAEILHRKAWKNDKKHLKQRCSWYSVSNGRMIQGRIVEISEKDGKNFYKIEALSSEDYRVKDKHGRMKRVWGKKVEEMDLNPPCVKGNVIFNKKNVCGGCKKVHLKGSMDRGLDGDLDWFCGNCSLKTISNAVPMYHIKKYHEHFGKPMDFIPEWLQDIKRSIKEHNTKVMDEEDWPLPRPSPLPRNASPSKKIDMNQQEKDTIWCKSDSDLMCCGGCNQKVLKGNYVGGNIWYCDFCCYTLEANEDSGKKKHDDFERIKEWLEAAGSEVVPDNPPLVPQNGSNDYYEVWPSLGSR